MKYVKNVHGVKLVYTFDRLGWSYRVSGFKDRATRMKAILHLYPKHKPETPSHLIRSVVDNNMELLEIVRSIRP